MRALFSALALLAGLASAGAQTATTPATGFPLPIGTAPGTIAAADDVRITRIVNVDDYGATGDGVTYDDTKFAAAFAALGPLGGVVNISASKAYHVNAGFKVPDYVSVRGALVLPDQAKGTAAGNFAALGSRLLVDSSSTTFTVGGAGGTTSSNLVPLTSLVGITANSWIDGPGLYRGTLVYGTQSATSSVNLNLNPTATIPAGSVFTQRSLGIVLGENSRLDSVLVQKYGMAATPFASSSAYQAETSTWANGGTGVTLLGYGSGLTNMAIVGFNQGFLVVRGGRQRIQSVNLDNWNGWSVGPLGDVMHISAIHAWPFVGASATYTTTSYDNYRGGVGQYIYRGANDTKVYDSFAFGYQTDAWVKDAQRVTMDGVDSDGTYGLVNNSGTAIATTGLLIDGGSVDFTCLSCQVSSLGDGFDINLIDANGNPLTYGAATIVKGKAFQNTGVDYHVMNGGLTLYAPSSRGPSPAIPVQADAGTTSLQVNDIDANGGTGNAFSINAAVTATVGKWGGVFSGYTDNLGNVVRSGSVLGNGNNLNLGTSTFGLQFQVAGATSGVLNPSSIAVAWGTNGGGHFGSNTGNTTIHGDVANSLRSILFYIGKNNYAAQMTLTAGLMESISTGLTATGTTQATALALTTKHNVLTTVASGTGVNLPAYTTNQTTVSGFAGAEITVINHGANAVLVYPPAGISAAIIPLGTSTGTVNAGVSVATGATARFVAESLTTWDRVQ